jgi:DNA-binding XRE family transcriptional regulator
VATTRAARSARDLPEGEVYREGTVQEFCGLTDAEMAEINGRLDMETGFRAFRGVLVKLVRERRKGLGLSQGEVAKRIGSDQSRIAKLEQGDASLDLIVRALFALGVSADEVAKAIERVRPDLAN